MTRKKYFQYDRITGAQKATILSHTPPKAFYQLELPEDAVTEGMMVDLNQDPPVLVPVPKNAKSKIGRESSTANKRPTTPKKSQAKAGRAATRSKGKPPKKAKR